MNNSLKYIFSNLIFFLFYRQSDFQSPKLSPDFIDFWTLVPFNEKHSSPPFFPFYLISHYIPFLYFLLSSVSLPWCVFISLSTLSLIPSLSPPPSLLHTCVNIVVSVSLCLCVCVGGVQHCWLEEEEEEVREEEKEAREGKKHRDRERSKAFTGTKHAVSIS